MVKCKCRKAPAKGRSFPGANLWGFSWRQGAGELGLLVKDAGDAGKRYVGGFMGANRLFRLLDKTAVAAKRQPNGRHGGSNGAMCSD